MSQLPFTPPYNELAAVTRALCEKFGSCDADGVRRFAHKWTVYEFHDKENFCIRPSARGGAIDTPTPAYFRFVDDHPVTFQSQVGWLMTTYRKAAGAGLNPAPAIADYVTKLESYRAARVAKEKPNVP